MSHALFLGLNLSFTFPLSLTPCPDFSLSHSLSFSLSLSHTHTRSFLFLACKWTFLIRWGCQTWGWNETNSFPLINLITRSDRIYRKKTSEVKVDFFEKIKDFRLLWQWPPLNWITVNRISLLLLSDISCPNIFEQHTKSIAQLNHPDIVITFTSAQRDHIKRRTL